MHPTALLTAALTITSSYASTLLPRDIIPQSPTAHELVRLAEPGSWLKDIVVRRDGTLLCVRLDKPSVYLVKPTTGAYSVITTFTNATGALGIIEYAPDVFGVTVGDFNIPTLSSTPGTYRIMTLDLSKGLNPDGTVTPTTLAPVPAASNLNGLAFRPPGTLYAADSKGFQIFSIDTQTRAVAVAVPPNPLLAITTAGFPLGITALQWDHRGQQLYFANLNRALLGRIPATGRSSFAVPQQIAFSSTTGGVDFDDFSLDPFQGNIYVVTGPSNTLNFVSRDSKRQFVINPRFTTSNTTILGGTSTAWGHSKNNSNMLYVTTNGDVLLGAQVIAFKFATT